MNYVVVYNVLQTVSNIHYVITLSVDDILHYLLELCFRRFDAVDWAPDFKNKSVPATLIVCFREMWPYWSRSFNGLLVTVQCMLFLN